MTNKVKALRTKLGLTQRELAERAGTSQQQIQRIETGSISTKPDLASRISGALGQPLDAVFPGMAKAVSVMIQKMKDTRSLPSDDELSELAEQGVEGDARLWTFKVLLRGHANPLVFPVGAADKRRIRRVLAKGPTARFTSFIQFDSRGKRVALNLREAVFGHLLFDPDFGGGADDEMNSDAPGVSVTFVGSSATYEFSADPDFPEDPEDPLDMGQLEDVLFRLDLDLEADDRVSFVDGDGEEVWLLVGDVALMEVRLDLIEPSNEDEDQEFAEDED